MSNEKYIYLLHFEDSIEHAQHYTGITDNPQRRFQEHFDGKGAVITREFASRKIGFKVVAVWRKATQADERHLKNKKNGRSFCPVCNKFKNIRHLRDLKRVPIPVLNASGIQTTWKHNKEEN